MKKVLILTIEFYQRFLSFDQGVLKIFAPGGACRNYPSCSEFTKQAVIRKGVVGGILLGVKRILLCNPWFGGREWKA